MKGIILAGGSGTRLYPVTLPVNKQLLPVFDKPMVYYSISTLMMAGIREMLVICTANDFPIFKHLLGDGSQWGIELSYKMEVESKGVAGAFVIGQDFIGSDMVCLLLGDNIFWGEGLSSKLQTICKTIRSGATVFGYHVNDPERYGVAVFDKNGKLIDIEEKPIFPQSNYAITGLYFYDNSVIEISKKLKPSARRELEITDINREYIRQGKLTVEILNHRIVWLDIGTPSSLLEAAEFIEAIESEKGVQIGCPEEIAWRMGFIDNAQLKKLAEPLCKSPYGQYLNNLIKGDTFGNS